MFSEQADVVYQRYRELVLLNPRHQFTIETCPDCEMDHGKVVGTGVLEPTPTIHLIGGGPPKRPFTLECQLCKANMQDVGEEDVLRWMDVIGSILMYVDLSSRGVYAGSEGN